MQADESGQQVSSHLGDHEPRLGIINEFLQAWERKESPRIEEYLSNFDPNVEPLLLKDLITIEFSVLGKQQKIDLESYYTRFPTERALIEQCHAVCVGNQSTLDYQGGTNPNSAASTWQLKKIGRFLLLAEIGQGSYGKVYKAFDTRLDRIVALKVPRVGKEVSAEEEARFVREAKAMGDLHHPHIVPVFDVGSEDGYAYLVSGFVSGPTLRQHLDIGRPNHQEVVRIIIQLGQALAYAHDRGVIHRDVKPGNVMLDKQLQPLLMDFGLARRTQAEDSLLTQEGLCMGTPAYMSPEQASGQSHTAGAAADQWSLGVMMYEMLAGVRPFQGPIMVILERVKGEEPPSLRTIDTTIPRDLATICAKCLEKKPEQRFLSCHELVEELQRWQRNEPILSRPIGPAERLQRWCRKYPVTASLSIATALLLVLGITGTSLGYLRAEEALSVAEAETAKLLAAEDRLRQGKTKSILQDAKLLTQRGNFKEANKLYEQLSSVKFPPREQFELLSKKYVSLSAVGRLAEASNLLMQVHALSPSIPAEIRGDYLVFFERHQPLLIPVTEGKPSERFRKLLKFPLAEEDKAWVLGMLAPKAKEAIPHFVEALEHDLFDRQSRVELIVNYVGLGDFNSAHLQLDLLNNLFPEDESIHVFRSLIFFFEGKQDQARQELTLAEPVLGKVKTEAFLQLLDIIQDFASDPKIEENTIREIVGSFKYFGYLAKLPGIMLALQGSTSQAIPIFCRAGDVGAFRVFSTLDDLKIDFRTFMRGEEIAMGILKSTADYFEDPYSVQTILVSSLSATSSQMKPGTDNKRYCSLYASILELADIFEQPWPYGDGTRYNLMPMLLTILTKGKREIECECNPDLTPSFHDRELRFMQQLLERQRVADEWFPIYHERLLRWEKLNMAEQLCKQWLQKQPDLPAAQEAALHTLMQQKRFQEAFTQADKFLAQTPQSQPIQELREQALTKLRELIK